MKQFYFRVGIPWGNTETLPKIVDTAEFIRVNAESIAEAWDKLHDYCNEKYGERSERKWTAQELSKQNYDYFIQHPNIHAKKETI